MAAAIPAKKFTPGVCALCSTIAASLLIKLNGLEPIFFNLLLLLVLEQH
jgi:hypothetical protein